jgi:hypothetical protein
MHAAGGRHEPGYWLTTATIEEQIMDLEVRTISFLSSGALSVEVNGGLGGGSSNKAALDVVKLWVYIPEYEKKSSIEEVMNAALKVARESLK